MTWHDWSRVAETPSRHWTHRQGSTEPNHRGAVLVDKAAASRLSAGVCQSSSFFLTFQGPKLGQSSLCLSVDLWDFPCFLKEAVVRRKTTYPHSVDTGIKGTMCSLKRLENDDYAPWRTQSDRRSHIPISELPAQRDVRARQLTFQAESSEKPCGRLSNMHPHPDPWNRWALPYIAKGLCRCVNKLRIKKGKGVRCKIAAIKTVTGM